MSAHGPITTIGPLRFTSVPADGEAGLAVTGGGAEELAPGGKAAIIVTRRVRLGTPSGGCVAGGTACIRRRSGV